MFILSQMSYLDIYSNLLMLNYIEQFAYLNNKKQKLSLYKSSVREV